MAEQNERNRLLAEEYRRNGGWVAEEKFKDAPLLLLTTEGRRSGRRYVNPLMYLPDGERYVIFASHQGAPEDPDWYKNLVAAGEATIEVGREEIPVAVVVTSGEERDELYRRHAGLHPRFAAYEDNTSRLIPVVALAPRR
ncbi:MAG TPA: nitroreductase family deazaflavin-dependent oxidoreductase [Acidimicrobiales bacterium]|nr:nitroreductase family deazaflavin-dependent oxidoreductase [Acidimicrobiales bacterium]